MPIPNSAGKGLSRQSLSDLRRIIQSCLRKYGSFNPEPASADPALVSARQEEINLLGRLTIEIDQELRAKAEPPLAKAEPPLTPRMTVLSFPWFAPPERSIVAAVVKCEINTSGELVKYKIEDVDESDEGQAAALMAAFNLGIHDGLQDLRDMSRGEGKASAGEGKASAEEGGQRA